jgi:hypothetical protein
VTWTPLNPEVLNIRGDTAIGNRPGVGRVVVSVDGWLRDTMTVLVTGEVVEDLLLAEDFLEFSRDEWLVVGQPAPTVRMTPDGPALSAGGDAVWTDGIRSRSTFPSDRGLTAEVLFGLELTERLDRQSVRICLTSDRQDRDASSLREADRGTSVCVMYPQGELSTFDAEALRLSAISRGINQGSVLGLPAPGLGSGEWASLGLQIRPDGRLSAIANGREVGVYPEPVPPLPGERFGLAIFGRAEDTELLIRSATVWRGTRY